MEPPSPAKADGKKPQGAAFPSRPLVIAFVVAFVLGISLGVGLGVGLKNKDGSSDSDVVYVAGAATLGASGACRVAARV